MIRGLAIAARALASRGELAAAATTRARLSFASTCGAMAGCSRPPWEGRAAPERAYLDDYVYLADGILELQQVRFRADELAVPLQPLLEVVLAHFADPNVGGFFFTSDDHEKLMHRPKSFGDESTPAGNGVAAYVLQRFGHLLGEPRYLAAAEGTLRAGWGDLSKYPQAHATLLTALEELLHPPQIVIIRGPAAAMTQWQEELARIYAPRRLVLGVPQDAPDLPAALADKAAGSSVLAYLCTGSVCSAPIESLSELSAQLRAGDSA